MLNSRKKKESTKTPKETVKLAVKLDSNTSGLWIKKAISAFVSAVVRGPQRYENACVLFFNFIQW